MKTQIRYKKNDGGDAVALVEGPVSDIVQAKRELAAKLDLPDADQAANELDALDMRLQRDGIVPSSISFDQISE